MTGKRSRRPERVYSALVHNWVFVTTNGLLLLNGLVGYVIVRHHRRHAKKASGQGASAGSSLT